MHFLDPSPTESPGSPPAQDPSPPRSAQPAAARNTASVRVRQRRPDSRVLAWSCFVLAVVAPSHSQAAPLTESQVRAAVETWVRRATADARPEAVILRLEPYQVDGRTVGYIAHLDQGGFCLCAADDRLLPVYLYSPRDQFDPTNPGLQYVLSGIGSRLNALGSPVDPRDPMVTAYSVELGRRSQLWRELCQGEARLAQRNAEQLNYGGPTTVSLPLTTRWHQGSPYNDACPNLTPGQDERTLVGCVATAMSQIMYYWKWPAAGTGSIPSPFPYKYRYSTTWLSQSLAKDPNIPASWDSRLRWDSTNGGTLWMTGYWDEESVYYRATELSTATSYQAALSALWNRMTQAQFVPSANFSEPINWSLMRDQHTDPVDAGDTAVAALCYQAGISVYMHYGIYFSTSNDAHVPAAVRDHFYYDPDVFHEDLNVAHMIEEIQWFRPIEMSGGPHAWIAYGYNQGTSPPQFLMNLGWGGTGVWYICDDIYPDDQVITIRIAPLNQVKFVGGGVSGDGSPSSPYSGIEQALANAPNGATLIFKAGSDNTFSAHTLRLNRPLTLKGASATLRRQ